MSKGARRLLLAAVLLPPSGRVLAQKILARTAIYLERNITDQYAEIGFEVTGADEG
jgi:hypothetical protein